MLVLFFILCHVTFPCARACRTGNICRVRVLIAPFTYVLVWLALRNPPPATAVAGCWLVRRQMSITSTKVQPYLETCRLRQRMSDYAWNRLTFDWFGQLLWSSANTLRVDVIAGATRYQVSHQLATLRHPSQQLPCVVAREKQRPTICDDRKSINCSDMPSSYCRLKSAVCCMAVRDKCFCFGVLTFTIHIISSCVLLCMCTNMKGGSG